MINQLYQIHNTIYTKLNDIYEDIFINEGALYELKTLIGLNQILFPEEYYILLDHLLDCILYKCIFEGSPELEKHLKPLDIKYHDIHLDIERSIEDSMSTDESIASVQYYREYYSKLSNLYLRPIFLASYSR